MRMFFWLFETFLQRIQDAGWEGCGQIQPATTTLTQGEGGGQKVGSASQEEILPVCPHLQVDLEQAFGEGD